MATKNTGGMTSLNNMMKNQKSTPVVPDEEPKAAVEPKKEPKNKRKSADLKQKQKKPRQ